MTSSDGRAPNGHGSNGRVSAAERLVVERASGISLAQSSSFEAIVAVEEAALERVDASLARHLVELDRRAARETKKAIADANRRDAAESDSQTSDSRRSGPHASGSRASESRAPKFGSSGPDVAAMLFTIVGFGIVMAGPGTRSSPEMISLDTSVALAGAGAILALALHTYAAVVASRPHYTAPETWKLLVASAASMLVTLGAIVMRIVWLDESADLALAVCVLLGVGAVVAGMLASVNRARWKRLIASVKAARNSSETRITDAALMSIMLSARAEAQRRFDSLPQTSRDEFDELVIAGLSSVKGSTESRAALLATYRAASRFETRYSV